MSSSKFAVFDIDGTLIRWQLYHALVDRLAKRGYLGEGVYEHIQNARMNWKIRSDDEGFYNYEKELILAFEDSAKSLDRSVFNSVAEEVFEQYKDQVYVYTRDLIAKLKGQGYILLAISGSHKELVGKIAKYYGFDDFVGTDWETGFVASHHKAELLKKFIEDKGLSLEGSYAVGDTASDGPMLELVENPIAFNPDKKLYEQAKLKGWKIVVERKNVVYDIQD